MSVLFMMPQWEDTTQGWMGRMLLGISHELSGVIVNDTKGERMWKDTVPAFSLRRQGKEVRRISTLFRFAGLTLTTATEKPEKALSKILRKYPKAKILCQYGAFATKFMRVWRESDMPLFIHFHGYDTFFDLRSPDNPNKMIHPDDYLENIKELESRATFIAGSNFLKSQLVNAGIASDRVIVKYYGVPVSEQPHFHRKKTDIKILHLGRLVDFKSPDRTIQAFEIAKSRGLDGQLTLVGDGPVKTTCELLKLRSPYRDSIQINEPIFGEGALNHYFGADIFTHHNITGEITHQAEGFGVSVVEAMANGLPIVGTRNGGVLETVVDGETGFLNEPGDVEAQADAFLELARNPELRQKMGDAGRARVSEYFSPEQERDQLLKIMGL